MFLYSEVSPMAANSPKNLILEFGANMRGASKREVSKIMARGTCADHSGANQRIEIRRGAANSGEVARPQPCYPVPQKNSPPSWTPLRNPEGTDTAAPRPSRGVRFAPNFEGLPGGLDTVTREEGS
eukprot:1799041-Pyramimonas_sp.AAC.1